MQRSLRYAIAGYGWVAREYVDPALRSLTNGYLTAVCDPDTGAASAARARGLAAYSDVSSLLGSEDFDALYVATPNHTHRAIVERAARAGKHVLCEKPMATTNDDASAMLAACRTARVLYATAYDQRYHPAHERLRDFVREGRLGTVTAVRLVYACWLDRAWSSDNWRVDARRSGGGALVDLVPHGLDLVCALLDDEIEDARALLQHRVQDYDVDDGAMVMLRLRSGVLAQLHVAYNYPETLPRRRLEVVGTRGIVVAIDTMGQTPGGTLTFTDAAGGRSQPLLYDGERSPFAGLAGAFTDAVLAGIRLDDERETRERATMRVLSSLLAGTDATRTTKAAAWR